MMMTTQCLVLIFGLMSTSMAAVTVHTQGVMLCREMDCPEDSRCSIQNMNVNGVDFTRKTCTDPNGVALKLMMSEGMKAGDAGFLGDGYVICYAISSMVRGKVNTTKACRDEDGNFRPMTAEEEQNFERRMAEAEAAARKAEAAAREKAKKLYEEGMKRANESLQHAHMLNVKAQEHAKRLQQQAMETAMKIAANMRHLAEIGHNRNRKLEEAAREREDILERRLEEAAARREEAEARRERAQMERERRLEEAQARREMKEQEREWKMNGFLPNFLDGDDW